MIQQAILGLAVADALGVPYEFKKRDTFRAKRMKGYGTHYQPKGTWSDDTSMTLATLDILGVSKTIDLDAMMDRFVAWFYYGEYTPDGIVFDIGGTTRKAILKYRQRRSINQCGGHEQFDNGNGSLMRILPLAFIDCCDEDIAGVSSLTHGHPIAIQGCQIYRNVAVNLIRGMTAGDALKNALKNRELLSEYSKLINIKNRTRNEIKSSGYVVDTLEAALWCVLNSSNYKECVLMAVNLGDDTDTIAAVAGGLAGILYGIGGKKGIPKKWIRQLRGKDQIFDICERLKL